AGIFERVREKGHSSRGGIKKRPRDFEICKDCQVFVADISGKRTVEYLAIGWRKRWCDRCKIVEQVVPVSRRTIYNAGYRKGISVKWRGRSVRSRMRRRSVSAEKQSRDQAGALHAARFVTTAHVESSEWNEIAIGRNVAIAAEQTAGALIEIGD